MVHARRLRPHRAHRHFVHLLHFHAVGHKCAPALVRLAIVRHPALMQHRLQLTVVLGRNQVRNRLAKIPQKPVARRSTLHHTPGQHRQPRRRIVSAQLFKLRQQVVGPVLRARFPAVIHHVMNAVLAHQLRSHRLRIAVQIRLKILAHIRAVHLVHFKARGLGRRRMIRDPQQRIAKAQHHPVARRRSPIQRSIRLHLRRQVNHARLVNRAGRIGLRRRIVVQIVVRHKRRLLLPMAQARAGVQHKLRQLVVGRFRRNLPAKRRRVNALRPCRNRRRSRVLEHHAEILRRRRRKRHRVLRRVVAGQLGHFAERHPVVTRLQHSLRRAHPIHNLLHHVRIFGHV